jgi:hypothetical protein
VRRRLADDELRVLGVVLELTADATGNRDFHAFADALLAETGAPPNSPEPFFTRPDLARYSLALRERTPEAMRRWGFVCATPAEDFRDAVRKFCA